MGEVKGIRADGTVIPAQGAESKGGGSSPAPSVGGGAVRSDSPYEVVSASRNNGLIGYGYNAWDAWADPDCATSPLFDMSWVVVKGRDEVITGVDGALMNIQRESERKLLLQKAGKPALLVDVTVMRTSKMFKRVGKNGQTYIDEIKNSVSLEGGYGAFEGSIKKSFNITAEDSTSKSFVTMGAVVRCARVMLPTGYKDYLRDDVRQKIDGATPPDAIFDELGTHYIEGANIGGRLEYNYSMSQSDSTRFQERVSEIEVKFKPISTGVTEGAAEGAGGGGAGGSAKIGMTKSSSNTVKSSSNTVSVLRRNYGGNDDLASDESVAGWGQSVRSNPTLCEFTTNGLKPIWFLCSDPKRAKEIEDAHKAYVDKKRPTIKDKPSLELRRANGMVWISDCKGSHSDGDYMAFGPSNAGDGWYYLGHSIEPRFGDPTYSVHLVQALGDDSALAPPLGVTCRYEDKGSGAKSDASFWQIEPPVGYRALGFVVSRGYSRPDLTWVRCVREDLTCEAEVGERLWVNVYGGLEIAARSTGLISTAFDVLSGKNLKQVGDQRVQAWRVRPKDPQVGVDLGLFYAQPNWESAKSLGGWWTLKRSVCKLPPS
jgi:hypothetical protein